MATERARGLAVLIAALISLVAFTKVARADEPVPPAPDTNPSVYPPPAAQPNLIVIGGVVTAAWYGAGVGVSYLWQENPGASSLRIPVAGPYIALTKTGCGDAEPTCRTFSVVLRTILTAASAVGQTGGTVAIIEGLFLPTQRASYAPPPARRLRRHGSNPGMSNVRVTPFVSENDAVGVGLSGNF